MSTCERCSNEHDGSYGSGRFCSQSCANTQKHSQETKDKISKSVSTSEIFQSKMELRYPNILLKDKVCPICHSIFKTYDGTYCSKICYDTDVRAGRHFSKIPKSGGYRPGSGIGKSGWFKGIFCNSTYELAWVIYNIEHDIEFQRNDTGFVYNMDGKEFKYYPDFIMNKVYIEIKGFLRPNDKFKFEQFPHILKILYAKDIKEHLDYCRSKYGCHFEELYEGNPHNMKLNVCEVCGKPAKNRFCSQSCCGKGYRI